MKTVAPSWQSAVNLPPTALAEYLDRTGWKRRGKKRPGVATWVRRAPPAKEPVAVLVPLDQGLPDFRPLLQRALELVAGAEERPIEALLVDVASPAAAVLQFVVEVEDLKNVGIPVRIAAAMLDVIASASQAAAAEAAEEMTKPPDWQEHAARRYLDRVRLEYSRPGSYVMNAVLPELLIEVDAWAEPGPLSVPTRLRADLSTLEEVLHHEVGAPEFPVDLAAWSFGREVVRALAPLDQHTIIGGSIELALSEDRPQHESTVFRLDRVALSRARELALELEESAVAAMVERRARPAPTRIDDAVVQGSVIRLERPDVTLEVTLDGKRRRVLLPGLSEHLYNQALEAHRTRKGVHARGVLTVWQNRATLREVKEFKPSGT